MSACLDFIALYKNPLGFVLIYKHVEKWPNTFTGRHWPGQFIGVDHDTGNNRNIQIVGAGPCTCCNFCMLDRGAVCIVFLHVRGLIMSAFICSDKHFAAIAYYCTAMHESVDPQTLADQLKRVNIQSVNYRYGEKTRATRCKLSATPGLSHADIVRLVQCWDYQSCENGHALDYLTMHAFLHSFFTPDQLETARDHSQIWTI